MYAKGRSYKTSRSKNSGNDDSQSSRSRKKNISLKRRKHSGSRKKRSDSSRDMFKLGSSNNTSSRTSSRHKPNYAAILKSKGTKVPQRYAQDLPKTQVFERNGKKYTIDFTHCRVIGTGSFGVVYVCVILETGTLVALKKVFQDRRFKNRELEVMKVLDYHPSCVHMYTFFYSKSVYNKNDVYLNLILEYCPDTIYRFVKSYTQKNMYVPWIYIKLFAYQLLRSVNYMHCKKLCHRDVKPQNLLIDPIRGILKLCDFGSAKTLEEGKSNIAYICSRYYRAPELIFGETNYTFGVDVWSCGCVIGEMMVGRPLFPGNSSMDQLVKIIRLLGTPSNSDIESMNRKYSKMNFPAVKATYWENFVKRERQKEYMIYGSRGGGMGKKKIRLSAEKQKLNKMKEENDVKLGCDLLRHLLVYNPTKRISAIVSLTHPFFDELRDPYTRLPNGKQLPVHHLFHFDQQVELSSTRPQLKRRSLSSGRKDDSEELEEEEEQMKEGEDDEDGEEELERERDVGVEENFEDLFQRSGKRQSRLSSKSSLWRKIVPQWYLKKYPYKKNMKNHPELKNLLKATCLHHANVVDRDKEEDHSRKSKRKKGRGRGGSDYGE